MERDVLPEIEYRILCRAVMEACRLLAAGDRAAGCRCLQAGLERACEFAAAGEAWAEDLAASYRRALEHYGCLPAVERPGPLPVREIPSARRHLGA